MLCEFAVRMFRVPLGERSQTSLFSSFLTMSVLVLRKRNLGRLNIGISFRYMNVIQRFDILRQHNYIGCLQWFQKHYKIFSNNIALLAEGRSERGAIQFGIRYKSFEILNCSQGHSSSIGDRLLDQWIDEKHGVTNFVYFFFNSP